jgi:hypothetical protein
MRKLILAIIILAYIATFAYGGEYSSMISLAFVGRQETVVPEPEQPDPEPVPDLGQDCPTFRRRFLRWRDVRGVRGR